MFWAFIRESLRVYKLHEIRHKRQICEVKLWWKSDVDQVNQIGSRERSANQRIRAWKAMAAPLSPRIASSFNPSLARVQRRNLRDREASYWPRREQHQQRKTLQSISAGTGADEAVQGQRERTQWQDQESRDVVDDQVTTASFGEHLEVWHRIIGDWREAKEKWQSIESTSVKFPLWRRFPWYHDDEQFEIRANW